MRKDIFIKNLGGIYYMKYKQFIILLFAAILTVILTGCGSTKNKEVTTTINSDTKSQENNVSFAEISKSNNTTAPENIQDDSKESETNPSTENAEAADTTTENNPPAPRNPLVLQSEDWGLNFVEEGSQPKGNADAADLAAYNAYFVGSNNEKVIYLTFDCGYENGNTEPILDALKKHNVPATFFVVGHFLETAPELVQRMVEDGHTVGNHTYHHPDMSAISTIEDFQKEVDDVADLFHEITGTELSKYYRAPQGKCNESNLAMAQQLGYATFFWSLAYVDWDTEHQPSRSDALDKLTKRIHSGAVVLLHNTSQTNGQILDELLTKWEEMGYTFRPLSDLCGA